MNKIVGFFKRLLKSRNLKYGTNSIILVAVVVAIAIIINLLVGMTNLKWDLTPNKLYSLSDTTKEILSGLNKDVTIYGLFDENKSNEDYTSDEVKEVSGLLEKYEKYAHVKVEYVDPDRNPGFTKDLDKDGLLELSKDDFVVKCGDKVKKLQYYDLFETYFDQNTFQTTKTGSNAEQGFTGAIKFVTADKTPTIYFTTGHDEGDATSEFKTVGDVLERNNYAVKTVNLLTEEKVPEDCEVLVVASPKKDLTMAEADKLQAYLKDGGNAFFMFDSLESNTVFTNYDRILADYNVSLNYDKVKENDSSRYVPGLQYDIIPDLQSNSINSDLNSGNFMMAVPNARSINILKNEKEYITTTSLLKTSDKAVGEQIDKTRGQDLQGPLDLAVAVENKGGTQASKIVVMGNSAYMSESTFQQYSYNGLYFFMYSMFWIQGEQDDTLIAPKQYENPTISITASEAQVMGVVVVIIFPLLILGSGLFVYLRRRHL